MLNILHMQKHTTFNVLNNNEMLMQLTMWKNTGCYCTPHNNKEVVINGRKMYSFVVNNDLFDNYCPLSLFKMNFMVSGC